MHQSSKWECAGQDKGTERQMVVQDKEEKKKKRKEKIG
jgi:hypothetical protein